MKKIALTTFILFVAHLANAQKSVSNAQYFDKSGPDITVAAKVYPLDWFGGTFGAGVEAMFADVIVVGLDLAAINKSEYSRGLFGLAFYDSPEASGNGFSVTVKANYVLNDDLLGDYYGIGMSYDYGSTTLGDGSLATYEVIGINYVQQWSFLDHFYFEGSGGFGFQNSKQQTYTDRGMVLMLNFAIGYIFNP